MTAVLPKTTLHLVVGTEDGCQGPSCPNSIGRPNLHSEHSRVVGDQRAGQEPGGRGGRHQVPLPRQRRLHRHHLPNTPLAASASIPVIPVPFLERQAFHLQIQPRCKANSRSHESRLGHILPIHSRNPLVSHGVSVDHSIRSDSRVPRFPTCIPKARNPAVKNRAKASDDLGGSPLATR